MANFAIFAKSLAGRMATFLPAILFYGTYSCAFTYCDLRFCSNVLCNTNLPLPYLPCEKRRRPLK